MALAGKGNMTPGRQRKKTEAQYFDVGKVGRKTGLVLKDTGIRDEHGMEPVSGIFSSPITSPQRNGDNTLSSDDMHMQESSAPDVTETLILRKTPKLPPARAATPKHTNIGSPKRMSAVRPVSRGKSLPPDAKETATSSPQEMSKTQPPANRVLDFAGDVVRRSIESLSPFKPRKAQRRSVGASRSDPFAPSKINGADVRPGETLPAKLSEEPEHLADVEEDADQDAEQDAEEDVEEEEVSAPPHTTIVEDLEVQQDLEEVLAPQPADNGPIMIDDDDAYQVIPDDAMPEEDEAQAAEEQETPIKRKRGRPRKSGDSVNSTQIQQTPQSLSTTKRKRGRPSLQSQRAEIDLTQSQVIEDGSDEAPVQKKQRGRPPKKRVIVLDDEEDQTIDPTILTHSNEDVAEDAAESSDHAQPKTKGKASAPAAPRERDANRAMRAASSPVKLNDPPSRLSKSPSKRAPSRGASMGPVSNVNLRATTPFEDAGERISRYGRPVLKPLQYWANETRVWKHGEVEGILRAEEVQKPKPAKKKGRKPGRKLGSGIARLDDIDEESDTESTVADEWEEEVGVIAGSVAKWNRSTQIGDPKELVREDLAFASSAIETRDVANSEFKYAKIMTLPFFGSGVVELPPAGFKRAKNSRKMQMCFFVHEGKVMVEVGAQGAHGEVNQFAISKGGVWVVPRGNNYAITNESRTKTARIFFAQGCEVDTSSAGASE